MSSVFEISQEASAVLIPADAISLARKTAIASRRSLVEVLEEQIALPREEFIASLASTLQYSAVQIEQMRNMEPVFDVLPYKVAAKKGCVLQHTQDNECLLIFSDPFDDDFFAWAQTAIHAPFTLCLAHSTDITAYLAIWENELRAIDDALPQENSVPNSVGIEPEELSLKSISEDTSPVIRLVNSSLYDALQAGASDIHLETNQAGIAIKYRVDGVLIHIADISDVLVAEQAISRIKVMAELDISEKRIPQDGRFRSSIKGRQIDFRVSIMPSIFGEDAVLRILDRQSLTDQVKGLQLESLGFDLETRKILRRFAKEPYGMVLVTGPTGSGKTTTLYALISEINNGQDKIITIEDPVEYQLSGVTQIPVNEKKGLTFAKGLRSILRHDPDKILVGEIRDSETAQIAVQSALTGHLVFTTVHANNVFDVIGRFVHMGVDTYSFVSALNGILAQRLLRVVCTNCAASCTPDEETLHESGISLDEAKQYKFVKGQGCGQCRGSGYKGRKAIAEFLHLNDEIRQLIAERSAIQKIKEAAMRNGTRQLRAAALDLVKNGETSLDEVNRVTFVA